MRQAHRASQRSTSTALVQSQAIARSVEVVRLDEQTRIAAEMLNDMRYVRMVYSSHIQLFKNGVSKLLLNAKANLMLQLTPLLSPGVGRNQLSEILDTNLNIFANLKTEKQERAALRALLKGVDPQKSLYIEPEKRDLVDPAGEKTGDFMYDFPADALLKRLIFNRPEVRASYACFLCHATRVAAMR